jgi:uncharacterized membrane protein YdjX (TVP38/TMEM64 family)
VVLAGDYLALDSTGVVAHLEDPQALRAMLQSVGRGGPAIVIGLIAMAIVMSPLPSAPIALSAGMAYGHTLGTVHVLVGAELGALTAFAIARHRSTKR